MVKLKAYIEQITSLLPEGAEVEVDIGVWPDLTVDPTSLNRIKIKLAT
jgi:hypothetical protein